MIENFMKAEDVAQILNLSKAMVYRLVQRGELRCIRIGTAVRIRPSDLEAYVANNFNTPETKPDLFLSGLHRGQK